MGNRGIPFYSLVFRTVIGGVLIYAGLLKALGPSAEFAAMIAAYKIVPASLTPLLAQALPYIEMWIGLFIFLGLYTRYASLAAAVLFATFLLALSAALVRGIDLVSCGCFGEDSLSPKQTMVMDLLLLGMAV